MTDTISTKQGLFRYVDKHLLVVPREGEGAFQRAPTSDARIKRMGEGWSWPLCGTLTVVQYPDNSLVVAEGGHRRDASLLRDDIRALPCMIFRVASVAEAATIFRRINSDRVRLGAVDDYRAAKVAQDPETLAVEKLVQSINRKIARHTGSSTIVGVATLVRLLRVDAAALKEVFPIAGKLFEGTAFDTSILHVLHTVAVGIKLSDASTSIKDHEDRILHAGLDAIRTVIAGEKLRNKSLSVKTAASMRVGEARAVVSLLNKGRRSNFINITFPGRVLSNERAWETRRESDRAA